MAPNTSVSIICPSFTVIDVAPVLVKVKEPEVVKLPVTSTEPENWWRSCESSPNLVEPDWWIIDEETNSVWNSWAVIESVITKEPVIDATLFPFIEPL